MSRTLTTLALGAASALTAGLLTAPPTQAAAGEYVALGDSYSSGTGTGEYLDDGTECLRSALAYPALVAAGQGLDLDFRACSGATIPDVRAAQLGALTASTSRVSISVGGNDAGFADVLTECALPAWASDCDSAIDGAQSYIAGTLPGAAGGLYDEIRAAAPNARVTVVGYPRIFMGEDCDFATFFSPEEQARLNQTADQVNATLAGVAAQRGFGYADPTSAFTGHAVCDSPEWINGLRSRIEESYHPNRDGHAQGYTPLVSGALGAAVTSDAALRRTASARADELAAEQRAHADLDAGIEPKVFRAPDLDSPRVKRAAAAADVDLADPASIAAADRRYAAAQARD